MLPRRLKLSRKSFPTQKDKKTSWRGLFLMFRYTFTNSPTPPRFAVVVPKKIVNKAVKRNKIKRIIYREIYNQKKSFQNWNGAKIVVSLQMKETNATESEIHKDIQDFFGVSKD